MLNNVMNYRCYVCNERAQYNMLRFVDDHTRDYVIDEYELTHIVDAQSNMFDRARNIVVCAHCVHIAIMKYVDVNDVDHFDDKNDDDDDNETHSHA